ncbi:hypothetical protein ICM05_02770 [Leucobacter sp. cx-42]|uniref:type II secretion system F family protein n=1 Tax=unclassified Leucobacter TaxID=2621730 RepID=UPI00165E1C96|nr:MULTISPECIES: hypothetical protein [unclassified Leucobacter]MBC9953574.1 hypothetical protein [Leucobacter sp. cx-42]
MRGTAQPAASSTEEYEELTWLLRRSASLLRGGIPVGSVLGLVLSSEREAVAASPRLTAIGARIATAPDVPRALAAAGSPAWRIAAAAWHIGEQSGAPMATVLDRLAVATQALIDVAHRRAVLVAGPSATVRLVAWLPPAAIGMGLLLGLNPLPVFVTPFGVTLVVIGALLEWCGVRWAKRMMASVARADRIVAVECELLWIALAGGAPPDRARRWVATAVDEVGAEWVPFAELMDVSAAGRVLAMARQTGVPAGALLLEAASLARAHATTQLERDAEQLGVRVLIPLAACILPAFVALGVAPVVVSLLSGVGQFG